MASVRAGDTGRELVVPDVGRVNAGDGGVSELLAIPAHLRQTVLVHHALHGCEDGACVGRREEERVGTAVELARVVTAQARHVDGDGAGHLGLAGLLGARPHKVRDHVGLQALDDADAHLVGVILVDLLENVLADVVLDLALGVTCQVLGSEQRDAAHRGRCHRELGLLGPLRRQGHVRQGVAGRLEVRVRDDRFKHRIVAGGAQGPPLLSCCNHHASGRPKPGADGRPGPLRSRGPRGGGRSPTRPAHTRDGTGE